MLARLLVPTLVMLSACTVGMIPRDLPPPEPATAVPATDASTDPAPASPAAPVSYKLAGNRLELPGPIVFTGDALDAASDPALEHARSYLVAKDVITLMRIEGHADDQAQSERRALVVARWLIAHGIDCKRLTAVGFGPTKPIADTSSPEGRAQNTRIELHNAQMRGKAIGGQPSDGGGQLAAADLCQ